MPWTDHFSESYGVLVNLTPAANNVELTWPDDFPDEYATDPSLRAFRVDGLEATIAADATVGSRRLTVELLNGEDLLMSWVGRMTVTGGQVLRIALESYTDRGAGPWGNAYGQEPLPINLVVGFGWTLRIAIFNAVGGGDVLQDVRVRGQIVETSLGA